METVSNSVPDSQGGRNTHNSSANINSTAAVGECQGNAASGNNDRAGMDKSDSDSVQGDSEDHSNTDKEYDHEDALVTYALFQVRCRLV